MLCLSCASSKIVNKELYSNIDYTFPQKQIKLFEINDKNRKPKLWQITLPTNVKWSLNNDISVYIIQDTDFLNLSLVIYNDGNENKNREGQTYGFATSRCSQTYGYCRRTKGSRLEWDTNIITIYER